MFDVEDLGARLAADVTFAAGARHQFTLKAGTVLADWEPTGASSLVVRFAGHEAVVDLDVVEPVVWNRALQRWELE